MAFRNAFSNGSPGKGKNFENNKQRDNAVIMTSLSESNKIWNLNAPLTLDILILLSLHFS